MLPVVDKRWKSCGFNGLTQASRNANFRKFHFKGFEDKQYGASVPDCLGLNTRRSGGRRFGSLTTWLNVPVVREMAWVKIRAISQDRPPVFSRRDSSWREGARWSPSHPFERWRWQVCQLPVGRRTGFKREFDPGSESTLAACLTHASRTRKWEQSREYSGDRVSNT
jgi:hypothetical protein